MCVIVITVIAVVGVVVVVVVFCFVVIKIISKLLNIKSNWYKLIKSLV